MQTLLRKLISMYYFLMNVLIMLYIIINIVLFMLICAETRTLDGADLQDKRHIAEYRKCYYSRFSQRQNL